MIAGRLGGQCLQGFGEVVDMKAEGAGLAFMADEALAIDEVEAIGPAGVGALDGVMAVIEEGRQFDLEVAHTGGGDVRALLFVLRVGEEDFLADVDGELPAVGGVGFLDVDDVEVDAIAVLAIELVEGGNLPPEGRSSIAAEDEDNGFGGELGRESDAAFAVVGFEQEVGGGRAKGEAAGAGDVPERLEGDGHHDRHGKASDDAGELFGCLTHDEEKCDSVERVKDGGGGQPFQNAQNRLLTCNFPKIKERKQ